MRIYSIEQFKAEFAKLGYKWLPFHIIGVRSAKSVPDKFDDAIFVVAGDKLFAYSATTNPGKDGLLSPANSKGTANLKPGQYIGAYQLGLHKGQYKALVQTGAPVTVFRDNDKDALAEETAVTESGFFGINIHRANASATSFLVGRWSEGCQVIANPDDFEELIALCEASGQTRFTYTLLKEF